MDWTKTRDQYERQTPHLRQHRTPNPIDLTGNLEPNADLFIGLYEGEYPELKGASAVAYSLVNTLLAFVGQPTPTSDDPKTQELLNEIREEAKLIFAELMEKTLVVGRWWSWPNWNAKGQKVFYELIPDPSTKVYTNIETREIEKVVTDEQFTISTGDTSTSIVNRRREFTPSRVDVKYSGDVRAAGNLIDRASRNPVGIMPVPFAMPSNKSVFGKVLFHLKSYHDTLVKWISTLTKFNVKMVQGTKNVSEWLKNNGATLGELDVETLDLVLNGPDESTDFAFPSGDVTEAFKALLEVLYHNIIEGSDVSEVHGGLNAAGNHASVETTKENLAKSVEKIQSLFTQPFHDVFSAALRLKMGATMTQVSPEFTMGWNDFEVLSETEKMAILDKFSNAVNRLLSVAGITMEGLHGLYMATFPKMTEADFNTWFSQLNVSAKFKQFAEASLADAIDVPGVDPSGGSN